MKISEAIEMLNKHKEKYGDIIIKIDMCQDRRSGNITHANTKNIQVIGVNEARGKKGQYPAWCFITSNIG